MKYSDFFHNLYYQVVVNIGFLLGWEMIHPTRHSLPLISPRIIEKLIGSSFFLLVTSASVCIYGLIGQLLMIHTEAVRFEDGRIDRAMNQLRKLNQALILLNDRFSSILVAVFISNAVNMTTCSFLLIRSMVNKEWFSISWSAFQITQNLIEIVIICWTADHLVRSSVIVLLKI